VGKKKGAGMYNKVIMIGNLTRDPELRYTPSGMAVATLGLAVNTRFKQNGEIKEETLYIDVITFGSSAENCDKFLNKGDPILADGRLRERQWEYEGQKKRKMEIIAREVRFLPKRKKDGDVAEEDLVPPDEATDLEPF